MAVQTGCLEISFISVSHFLVFKLHYAASILATTLPTKFVNMLHLCSRIVTLLNITALP